VNANKTIIPANGYDLIRVWKTKTDFRIDSVPVLAFAICVDADDAEGTFNVITPTGEDMYTETPSISSCALRGPDGRVYDGQNDYATVDIFLEDHRRWYSPIQAPEEASLV
jgi:hypothetical protein